MDKNNLNNLEENVSALVDETLGPVLKALADAFGTLKSDVEAAATKTEPVLQSLGKDVQDAANKIKSQIEESMRQQGEVALQNSKTFDEGARELKQKALEKIANTAENRFKAALDQLVKELATDKIILGWLAPELDKFAKNINNLCSELQSYIERCGCSCGSTDGGGIGFADYFGSGTYGGGDYAGAASYGGVHVEVHNHSPQQQGSGRSAGGGRDIHKLVGDMVAKDLRRGGPAANAMKRAFGVARQPIQR